MGDSKEESEVLLDFSNSKYLALLLLFVFFLWLYLASPCSLLWDQVLMIESESVDTSN